MKTFHHRFRVRAPLEDVASFHRRSSSMAAITPPPVVAQIHRAPVELQDGDDMEFTLWLGPLPIRWLARIEEVTPNGFLDRQVAGPFRRWDHRHTYLAVSPNLTDVFDTISIEFKPGLLDRLIGVGMWINLPVLFAFRAWKTARILKRPKQQP